MKNRDAPSCRNHGEKKYGHWIEKYPNRIVPMMNRANEKTRLNGRVFYCLAGTVSSYGGLIGEGGSPTGSWYPVCYPIQTAAHV